MRKLDQRAITLVEVLVVLAIISMVFVIGFNVFGRYFGQESFRQGVQLFSSHLNDVLNDVQTGVFPTYGGIKCEQDTSTPPELELSRDPDARPGEGNDCLLLGKAVQLGTGGNHRDYENNAKERNEYIIHTLIGLTVDNFEDSGAGREGKAEKFQVFYKDFLMSPPEDIDTSVDKFVPQSVEISRVYFAEDRGGTPGIDPNERTFLDGFAVIVSSFGEFTANDLEFKGGSRNISLYAIYIDDNDPNDIDDDSDVRPNEIEFRMRTDNHNPNATPPQIYYHKINQPIIICLQSGTGELAYIRVGSLSGSLEALPDLNPERAEEQC